PRVAAAGGRLLRRRLRLAAGVATGWRSAGADPARLSAEPVRLPAAREGPDAVSARRSLRDGGGDRRAARRVPRPRGGLPRPRRARRDHRAARGGGGTVSPDELLRPLSAADDARGAALRDDRGVLSAHQRRPSWAACVTACSAEK